MLHYQHTHTKEEEEEEKKKKKKKKDRQKDRQKERKKEREKRRRRRRKKERKCCSLSTHTHGVLDERGGQRSHAANPPALSFNNNLTNSIV